MNNLGSKVIENAVFVAQFAAVVVAFFLIAYIVEKQAEKKRGNSGRVLTTKKITMIGLFSAISTILMMIEFPLPFAPAFYKLDFSELPVLIVTFAFGPVTGVMTEFCKILLHLLFRSTTTAFVGELANFAVGCTFILPAGVIYVEKKSKRNAILACVAGTLIMTVFGSAFNAVYLLPKFAELYGMPLDAIIAMGTKINPAITSVSTLVFFSVAPLNLLKGGLVSLLTMIMYKRLSPILHNNRR